MTQRPQLPAIPFRLAAAACLLSLLAVAGCQSASEGYAGGFASVTIQNHSQEEIAAAAAQVFAAEGYAGGLTSPGKMVFEKAASRGTSLAREGLVAGFYGAQTINRVRLDIAPVTGGTSRLDCKAYMVSGGSDPFFQDEVPVTNARGGPYQKLLNQIAAQLQ